MLKIATMILAISLIIEGGLPEQPTAPAGLPGFWVKRDTGADFVFYAPPEVKPISARGVHTVAAVYEAPYMNFRYNRIGAIERQTRDDATTNFQTFVVDGKEGLLTTHMKLDPGWYVAEISFQYINGDGTGYKFTGWCTRAEYIETLRTIVTSMHFDHPAQPAAA